MADMEKMKQTIGIITNDRKSAPRSIIDLIAEAHTFKSDWVTLKLNPETDNRLLVTRSLVSTMLSKNDR